VTISSDDDLKRLKAAGRVCALAREVVAAALRPGITTADLDAVGAAVIAEHGARSAPSVTYGFPGATCISVNEEVAHGIPGERVIVAGDLVNIDVSVEVDGVFADTGASYLVASDDPRLTRLCRDGKRATWEGIRTVRSGAPFSAIGDAVGSFARRHGYSLLTNLASHGVGDSLHDEPREIATWPNRSDRRRMRDGIVFTIEPFLSLGGRFAVDRVPSDGFTLLARPSAPTVQFEHTVVATPRGAIVVTL
jgi:methionyl aminopeptidase